MTENIDHRYMEIALEEAKEAEKRDEVPIGAVLVCNETNEIIAQNGNRTIERSDPTAHAEILCIREACKKIEKQRVPGTTLYVTLEPCTMCAAAIAFARVDRLVIGAIDPKGGGVLHGAKFFEQETCHHKINIDHGTMADECSLILKEFFQAKRKKD